MKKSIKSVVVGALASISVMVAPMTAWAGENLATGQTVPELADSGAAVGGLAGLAVLAILGGAILLRRNKE